MKSLPFIYLRPEKVSLSIRALSPCYRACSASGQDQDESFYKIVLSWQCRPASAILHEIPALWGDVTRDDSQRRFLAQHSVATLLRQCFEWSQHSVPAHYNAGLRRKSSLRIVPCNITLTREKVFFGPTTNKVCKATRLFIVKKVGLASGYLYWLDQYPAI